jgi:hypothetical protein
MYDETSRRASLCGEDVSNEIIATARLIRDALRNSDAIGSPPCGLFVLALQQVVDSFVASLLTDEAFEWLRQERYQTE